MDLDENLTLNLDQDHDNENHPTRSLAETLHGASAVLYGMEPPVQQLQDNNYPNWNEPPSCRGCFNLGQKLEAMRCNVNSLWNQVQRLQVFQN